MMTLLTTDSFVMELEEEEEEEEEGKGYGNDGPTPQPPWGEGYVVRFDQRTKAQSIRVGTRMIVGG